MRICNILLAHPLGLGKTKRTLEVDFGEKSTTSGTVMFKLLAYALKKYIKKNKFYWFDKLVS